VASALVSECQEESCVDENGDKTSRYIPLLPPHNELHVVSTAQVSSHDQVHAESGLRSPPNQDQEVHSQWDVSVWSEPSQTNEAPAPEDISPCCLHISAIQSKG